jgi:hypothetical protein
MSVGSPSEVLDAIGSGDSGKLEHVKRQMEELGVLKSVFGRIQTELTAARASLAAFLPSEETTLLLDLCSALELQASEMGNPPRGVSG